MYTQKGQWRVSDIRGWSMDDFCDQLNERDDKIAEMEDRIDELDDQVASLEATIKELEDAADQSTD